jgi:NitT/TauT family transport system substrate-binding protein/sulfonate transport system substrate-binding protein
MVGGAVVMLALALVAGTGGVAQEKVYQAAAAVGNNMNHVPSFVGVEKGIFLKHGVDLKLKVLSTGQEMMKAVQAGEAQFLGSAYSNFPLGVERGFKGKGIVGLLGDRTGKYWDETVSIVTRKGTGITKVQDLVGKKVGTAIGGTGHEYLDVVLKKAGIPADKVPVLNVPPGNSVSALAGGQVDAISMWEPYGTLMLEKVPDAVLVQRGGGFIGYFIDMSTLVDVMEKQPDMVYRYVVGLAEASQYTRQHLDEAAEIATRWIPGLEPAMAQKAIRYMCYDSRITKYSLESWDENVRVLVEQKKMRQPIPWTQGTELKFIERAQKEYPQFFSDLKRIP